MRKFTQRHTDRGDLGIPRHPGAEGVQGINKFSVTVLNGSAISAPICTLVMPKQVQGDEMQFLALRALLI